MPEIIVTNDADMSSPKNKPPEPTYIDLSHYRKLVRSYIDMVCFIK